MKSAWNRLQQLSCEHSFRLWQEDRLNRKWQNRRSIGVPSEIQENVELLGRGDEAEIKSRVFWYITFQPAIFDACSKRGWEAL